MTEYHSGFCIRSIRTDKICDTHISQKKGFDFSEALESVYPLLNIIFSYLSKDDLKKAAEVKESWKIIAEEELLRRVSVSWITCYKGEKKSNSIDHSNNLHLNNSNIGIILYDYRRLKLNKYICLHTPEITKMTFAEYFAKEVVPTDINYCLISCAKVVSCFNKDLLNINGSLFDGIFLPHIPNIRITMFHCNPAKHVQETISTYIKPNESAKCILLFSIGSIHKSIENFFKYLIPSENVEKLAVCGGIIRGTKTFQQVTAQRTFSANDMFCICFLEDIAYKSDFNAISCVIEGDDLTDEEFETELLKLKSRIIMRTHSLAIRICCAAKWAKDSETPLFHKVFPEIPLLGLEADGELGWNSYSETEEKYDEPSMNAKKTKRSHPKLEHKWSTILLIITWGELLKRNY